jgi:hypothetical protein
MRILPLISHPHPDGTSAPFSTLVCMVMCIPAMLILALSLIWNYAQADGGGQATNDHEQSVVHHIVTGTLTTLDLKAGKGMLKTDLGKPVFFDLVRPDLFQSVSVGQRVSIGLTENGQVVKVMETPPAELMAPADQ